MGVALEANLRHSSTLKRENKSRKKRRDVGERASNGAVTDQERRERKIIKPTSNERGDKRRPNGRQDATRK